MKTYYLGSRTGGNSLRWSLLESRFYEYGTPAHFAHLKSLLESRIYAYIRCSRSLCPFKVPLGEQILCIYIYIYIYIRCSRSLCPFKVPPLSLDAILEVSVAYVWFPSGTLKKRCKMRCVKVIRKGARWGPSGTAFSCFFQACAAYCVTFLKTCIRPPFMLPNMMKVCLFCGVVICLKYSK